MAANHVHDAIAQVRRLRELVLEKRTFRGYSGTARMCGGLAALAGTILMSGSYYPPAPLAHLLGWAGVLVTALAVNYGALAAWSLAEPDVRSDPIRLMPVLDAMPALAVGAVLSALAFANGRYESLFPIWMCLYGLAHVPYRHSLPATNYGVGVFYMVCGSVMGLGGDRVAFTNPWPMGIVFFIGETAGGYVLYRNRNEVDA